MRAYVGVTGRDWYEFLAARPDIREVNFWRPRDSRAFRRLQPGEPFLFKTRAPQNAVVGGGIFEAFVVLTISSAWQFFGEGNGVGSVEDLVARIRAITRESTTEIGDREIGCVLLRDVSFFKSRAVLPAPPSFSSNVVQGRAYDYPDSEPIVDTAVRMVFDRVDAPGSNSEWENLAPTRGAPRLTIPRLGQGGFQAVVQQAYSRRCAVTGHKIVPTLQAAHIVPVSAGGQHRVDNGLPLRSDVHTMFDFGYLGVDTDYRLHVSPRLRREFNNGAEFYSREGAPIAIPLEARSRPSPEFLTWHLESVR